jgi:hypothetical protein
VIDNRADSRAGNPIDGQPGVEDLSVGGQPSMCLDRNVDPLRLTVDGARAHPHHHAAGGALLGTRHRGPAVRVYPRQDEEVVVAPRRIR